MSGFGRKLMSASSTKTKLIKITEPIYEHNFMEKQQDKILQLVTGLGTFFSQKQPK